MAELFANNAQSTLASSVSSSATTLPLATGTGASFPSPSGGDFFRMTLTQPGIESSWEIVRVTARSGDSVTVVRAQEGTSAASWAAGSKAELRLTAGAQWSLSNIDQSISPTWSGTHRFNQAVGIGASNSNSSGSMLVVAGAQFNSLLVRSTGSSGGVGSSDIYLGSASGDASGGIIGYDHTTDRLIFGTAGAARASLNSVGAIGLGASGSSFGTVGQVITSAGSGSAAGWGNLPAAANPTANVGLTAVNGSAATFMRSDAAPALDQSIAPTWTGFHVFSANPTALPSSPVSAAIRIAGTDAGVGTSILIDTFGGAGVMAFRRSGGTAASPTSVTSGQGLFNLQGFGYAGSGYTATAPAVLSFNANENWSSTNQGTRAQFLITPNGSTGSSRVVAWQLTTAAMVLPIDNQEVQIGAGTDLRLYHDGTDSVIENDTGNLVLKVGGELSLSEVTTATTAPSAGGAGALPATPAGYMTTIINGTTRQIPYY